MKNPATLATNKGLVHINGEISPSTKLTIYKPSSVAFLLKFKKIPLQKLIKRASLLKRLGLLIA